jgi:IS30 family transposase
MPGGRRPVLDEATCFEICRLVAAGYSVTAVARRIGRDRKTIERHARHDHAFGLRLRSAKFVAEGHPLETIRRAAASNPRAAAWLAARPRIHAPQLVQSQQHSEPPLQKLSP